MKTKEELAEEYSALFVTKKDKDAMIKVFMEHVFLAGYNAAMAEVEQREREAFEIAVKMTIEYDMGLRKEKPDFKSKNKGV
jgi:hypothetical protein